MSLYLDDIAPSYLRERRLILSLGEDASPAAHQSLEITVDYSRADPEGIVLPLVLEVQGPSRASYQKRVFQNASPGSLIVTPREGGLHLVTLREFAHNRWWGSVTFDVAGGDLLLGQ